MGAPHGGERRRHAPPRDRRHPSAAGRRARLVPGGRDAQQLGAMRARVHAQAAGVGGGGVRGAPLPGARLVQLGGPHRGRRPRGRRGRQRRARRGREEGGGVAGGCGGDRHGGRVVRRRPRAPRRGARRAGQVCRFPLRLGQPDESSRRAGGARPSVPFGSGGRLSCERLPSGRRRRTRSGSTS